MFISPITDFETLKARIIDALVMVTKDMFENVQQEIVYCLDVLQAKNGEYSQVHKWYKKKKKAF